MRTVEGRGSEWSALVLAVAFLVPLFMGGCGEKGRQLWRTLSPPDDFCEPLAIGNVILSESGREFPFELTTKYPGSHTVAIGVSSPPRPARAFETEVELTISFYSDTKGISTFRGNTTDWPYWQGNSDFPGGMDLLVFEVPDDVPLREPVRCVLHVATGDPSFHKEYGSARLEVRKIGDK